MVARYSLVLDGAAIKELPVGDTLAGQATSGANSDITSLTGLTTALSAAQGGTGLTAAGTAGNVLTSTGTGWTSGAAPSSNGGATTTSSAANITLTAASNRVQAVTMTVASLSVILPVATTLTTGGALFVIKNYGTITFAVRNSANALVAAVAAGQIVSLYLSDNSTAAGVWAAGNGSTSSFLSEILNGASLSLSSVDANNTAITAMSATQAVVAYVQGTGIRARTLNISGTTMTAGTDILVDLSSGYFSVTRLSATQAVIGFLGTTSSRIQLCTLDISGTTITAGTMFTTTIYSGSGVVVTGVSATQAMCVTQVNYDTMTAFTVNVSGSVITVGATLSMAAFSNAQYTGGTSFWATALSATQVIMTYAGYNGYLETCTLNISGTTITSGTVLVTNTMNSNYVKVTPLSTTQALVTYDGTGGTLYTRTLNISGTTVTTGIVLNTALVASWMTCAAISASKVLVCCSASSELKDLILTITGTSVAAGAVSSVNAISHNYLSVANLSVTQSLVVGKNSSTGFANATLIETAL